MREVDAYKEVTGFDEVRKTEARLKIEADQLKEKLPPSKELNRKLKEIAEVLKSSGRKDLARIIPLIRGKIENLERMNVARDRLSLQLLGHIRADFHSYYNTYYLQHLDDEEEKNSEKN